MSFLQCCPDCNEYRTPLMSLSHHPTHMQCKLCQGEWFSRAALEKKVSHEFLLRTVSVMENQVRVPSHDCLFCQNSKLNSVYPLFRYPSQEELGVIQKLNPRWTNVPSYCELHLCGSCFGSWIKASDVLKLPELMPERRQRPRTPAQERKENPLKLLFQIVTDFFSHLSDWFN